MFVKGGKWGVYFGIEGIGAVARKTYGRTLPAWKAWGKKVGGGGGFVLGGVVFLGGIC